MSNKGKRHTRALSMLVALALVVSFGLVATTPAAAQSTWYVATTGDDATGDGSQGDPWATIQHAIDQADSGDTIMVAAGTYAQQLTIDKGITLRGSGPDTIIDGGAGRAIRFRSPGSGALTGVHIVDFRVTGQVGASFDGAMFPEGLDVVGVEFARCVFAATEFDGIGITHGAQVTDITVMDSVFEAASDTDNAIGISGASTVVNGLTVSGGTVNVATTGTSQGLLVFGGATLNNLLVEGVTFNNPSRTGIMFQDCTVTGASIQNSEFIGDVAAATGYGLYMGSSAAPAVISDLTVSNVEFRDQTESAIIAFRLFDISGLTVTNCLFDNNRGHITLYRLGDPATLGDILIQGNTFKALLGWHCIWLANGVTFSEDDVVVHNNCFISGGSGVNNAVGVMVDALLNWWGDASGPTHASNPDGIGDTVSDDVAFDPWLTGLAYTGGTAFTEADDVLLEATLSSSDNGGVGGQVHFYLDGNHIGSDLTDVTGVAELSIGILAAGTYQVIARSAGCLEVSAEIGVEEVPPPTPPTAGLAYPGWTVLLAGLVAGSLLMLRRRRRGQESAFC